ncbi:hypothetical protein ACNIZ4_26110, partial [Escherichia coli]
TFDQTALQGGFFVYRQQITRRKKGSQEDPLIFLLQTSLFDSPESVLARLCPPLVTFRHQKRSRFLRAFGTVSMEAGGGNPEQNVTPLSIFC